MAHHRLTLTDRGLHHVHRWLPSCSCKWAGVPRRRRREAIKLYLQHKNGEFDKRQRVKRGLAGGVLQPVTPAHELPESLR